MTSGGPVEVLLDTLRFGEPDRDAARIAWSTLDTSGVAPLLAGEMCELWLYRRLRALDLLEAVEPSLGDWLASRAQAITAQNMLVDVQTETAIGILNGIDVPHVCLKGVAKRLRRESFPYCDARSTSDVDLLIPEARAEEAFQTFLDAGFRGAFDPALTPDEHYHFRPIVSDVHIPVELHVSTSGDLSTDESWSRQTRDAVSVESGGGSTTVPSATEIFWHALTHGMEHGPAWFGLRSLLDLVTVWVGDERLDWGLIRDRLGSREVGDARAARIWLGAARWLAGPDAVATDELGKLPQGHLRRVLRWRLAVHRRGRGSTDGLTGRLLEEGARAELGAGLTPFEPAYGVAANARRRTGSVLARGLYAGWRTTVGR